MASGGFINSFLRIEKLRRSLGFVEKMSIPVTRGATGKVEEND